METIPVDLIAGMKHAGKTTLINALLQGPYRGRDVAVFTNEVGNASYVEGCQVHTVLGGCICCTAQAELITSIRNVLWFDMPERLIIELSGKAVIRDMLQMFSFLPDCRPSRLIYVLDARKFRALSTVMGSGFSGEVQASPVILLNHWPDLPQEEQEAIRAQLLVWNPTARFLTDFREADSEENPVFYRDLRSTGPDLAAGDLPHTAFRRCTAAGGDTAMKQLFREKAAHRHC